MTEITININTGLDDK